MTVQPAYNLTIPDRTIPYITTDQYRAAPTAMNTQSLIRQGDQTAQDNELRRIIRQASGWCDSVGAEQPLTAQITTESMRATVTPDKRLLLHPKQFPIMAVTGCSYGPDPSMLSAMNSLASVWVERQSVVIPLNAVLAQGFTGPLQFGTARPGSKVYVALSYVAGYAVTTLTSVTASTDLTLRVVDATGFVPGQQIRVEQGGAPSGTGSGQTALVQAVCVVSSVDLIQNIVTLRAQVGGVFAAGAAVTAMPEEVEQACIFVTTGLLKQPGAGTLSMGSRSASVKRPEEGEPGAEEFDEAEAILARYRPVAP